MPAVIPPQEHSIQGITPDGKLVVRHSTHLMQARFSGIVEDEGEGKKVSKEIQRERQKVAKYDASMTETTETTIGASPADDFSSHFTYEEPKAVMVRIERRTIPSFIKFKKRYDAERIPEVREEIRQKMIETFGTMSLRKLQDELEQKLQDDPRLDVLTSRGQVIRTTVSLQKEFARERNAAALEGGKK